VKTLLLKRAANEAEQFANQDDERTLAATHTASLIN
jgi:hypothetical protein